jgi:hypothetical protein
MHRDSQWRRDSDNWKGSGVAAHGNRKEIQDFNSVLSLNRCSIHSRYYIQIYLTSRLRGGAFYYSTQTGNDICHKGPTLPAAALGAWRRGRRR